MKDVFTSVKRTPYQSLASFLILFLTLLLSLFFFHLTSFFHGVLTYAETRPQVLVFFEPKTEESAIFTIRDTLQNSGKVESIDYTSQEEALQNYREANKNEPLVLEFVSADILPASLGINAKRPEHLAEIVDYLNKQSIIQSDDIIFQKDILDQLLTVTEALRRASIVVFILLFLTAFLVLMTTTAFKIALKRDEIELLRLLGASTFYIKKPLLIEGILFGLVAGTLSFALYYGGLLYAQTFLTTYNIPQLTFYGLGSFDLLVWPPSLNFILLSYALIILFGMTIGFFGTLLSSSKYIK